MDCARRGLRVHEYSTVFDCTTTGEDMKASDATSARAAVKMNMILERMTIDDNLFRLDRGRVDSVGLGQLLLRVSCRLLPVRWPHSLCHCKVVL